METSLENLYVDTGAKRVKEFRSTGLSVSAAIFASPNRYFTEHMQSLGAPDLRTGFH